MNALLTEALHAFRLDSADAQFLQHNENLTYRVDGKYLLRIHKAAEGMRVDHTPDLRRAELAFLRHLSAKGMPVQAPIAEATLPDGTMATLLTWLEGRSLTNDDLTMTVCRDLGRMLARLHHAAEGFTHPHMRRYDTAYYLDMTHKLDALLACREIPHAACEAVALSIGNSATTVIHADLSPSNILLTAGGLAPIDFSLCGFGHPMLDLGILIASLCTPAQMKSACEGYGTVSRSALEAGFAAGLLGCFVFHPDWPKEPWFRERISQWERQILLPVAEGHSIFDNDMNFVNE